MYNIFHQLEIKNKKKEYSKILKKVNFIIKDNENREELDIIKEIFKYSDIEHLIAFVTILINKTYKINVYEEQIFATIALYKNNVLDMKTGEGKTIVALITSIIHALQGKKVHIVTANDYLVNRDFNYGVKIFEKLNISSSVIDEKSKFLEKRIPYSSSIVYVTAKTLSFDFLNDSLMKKQTSKILPPLNETVVIIDEIDFILIEEARSPISISGKDDNEGLDILIKLNEYINQFNGKDDFFIDEKTKNIEFNDIGFKKFEDILVNLGYIKNNKDLYTSKNTKYLQFFLQTIKAHYILKKDIDYVILNNTIVIVDENTGRLVNGKTWTGGLHQAVEIKENLKINKDSKTLATTSLQGFFSKYGNLSGMSGTSKDDEIEFKEIYNLDVIDINTHKKSKRKIVEDILFSKKEYAINFLVDDVIKNNNLGRPILIGTTNIKDSELIYNALTLKNIKSEILNAKNHEKESLIIEDAGKFSKITITTNMAGRGTDIMLGGNKANEIEKLIESGYSYADAENQWIKEHDKINDIGGLYVIGFSRSSSKKLDNQLLGRCARQGDNGSCRFYITLEDELLSIFGKSAQLLFNTITMGVKDVGISDRRLNKSIKESQKRSENFHFNYRKNILRYSQITEKQFDIISNLRNKTLDCSNFKELFNNLSEDVFSYIIEEYKEKEIFDQQYKILKDIIYKYSNIKQSEFDSCSNKEEIKYCFLNIINNKYLEVLNYFEENGSFEKNMMIEIIDNHWIEHLTALENIKKGTTFRSFAQKNPFEEFKIESYKFFNFLIKQIFIDTIKELIILNPIDLLNKKDDNGQNFEINNVNYVFLNKVNNYGF